MAKDLLARPSLLELFHRRCGIPERERASVLGVSEAGRRSDTVKCQRSRTASSPGGVSVSAAISRARAAVAYTTASISVSRASMSSSICRVDIQRGGTLRLSEMILKHCNQLGSGEAICRLKESRRFHFEDPRTLEVFLHSVDCQHRGGR